jgi:predicted nucleic-acid-binding protein
MIGLDTKVLVRYFAQDDAVQSKKAMALMESLSAERPGYVSQAALLRRRARADERHHRFDDLHEGTGC